MGSPERKIDVFEDNSCSCYYCRRASETGWDTTPDMDIICDYEDDWDLSFDLYDGYEDYDYEEWSFDQLDRLYERQEELVLRDLRSKSLKNDPGYDLGEEREFYRRRNMFAKNSKRRKFLRNHTLNVRSKQAKQEFWMGFNQDSGTVPESLIDECLEFGSDYLAWEAIVPGDVVTKAFREIISRDWEEEWPKETLYEKYRNVILLKSGDLGFVPQDWDDM